jgi:hypothetical protein
MRVIFSLLKM